MACNIRTISYRVSCSYTWRTLWSVCNKAFLSTERLVLALIRMVLCTLTSFITCVSTHGLSLVVPSVSTGWLSCCCYCAMETFVRVMVVTKLFIVGFHCNSALSGLASRHLECLSVLDSIGFWMSSLWKCETEKDEPYARTRFPIIVSILPLL